MYPTVIECIDYGTFSTKFHTKYIANFHHLHLNNSCINVEDHGVEKFYVYDKTIKTNFYKELFRSPKEIDAKTS